MTVLCISDPCRHGGRGRERGSLLFYILLAVILFAALSFVLMRSMQTGGDFGSDEVARLGSQLVLDYAAKARITVQDMKLDGIAASDLSFLQDGDAGYGTAPHNAKVFHPLGGGLPLTRMNDILVTSALSPAAGIYMTRNAIDDVGSGADDIILSVRGLEKKVCERINWDLTGSPAIPSTGASNHEDLFILGTTDLTAAVCAGCAGKHALCVSQTGPVMYTFYSAVDPN